ncbi:p53-like transcription factor [Durotheca rogersii]|uniref:p53-like transcription factor n=1 Tax=Durotheca rogersii TaxID=419775 RepID=UPI00222071E6|nr:p53-like transcription factor [Durotheca rogersii]KAI5865449.1 p53-like transcription factor [Durotheca rogersii]
MAELKTEPTHSSLWSNYGGPVSLSTRFPNPMDSNLSHPSTTSSQHPGRPRSSHPTIDHPYPYPRYPQEESDAFDRYPQPSLTQHHSFPNLKRPHQPSEHPPYQEIVQDLRDDGSKITVNHDHKLLSFRRVQDKHTIVDQHGRIQQLELSAQLHGMFFLSEMPSSTSDGAILQPELTCYRRNLFQISGSLITPRGQLSVILPETGETVPVNSTEVTISAIESVDGHPVRLIVIPWKTPPPNSPELPQTPDQEPPSLPLIPFPDDGQEADGEYAVYPIGWRRLQFRIATANNGRRKELQQHFVLHLKVVGTLTNGSKVVLTESTTAPIVVRGRSPRNFQARKEIPLLGSSAGSRGQALVETGLGIVAGPLTVKPQDPKLRGLNLELPRTAFTFNASKLPGSPMAMRSNSYPSWNPPSQLPLSGMPASATASYPPASIPADSYQKMPLSGTSSFTQEPQEIPMQTSMPSMQLSLAATEQQPPAIRTQYAYVQGTSAPPQLSVTTTSMGSSSDHGSLSVPRYVDSNPRPAKSPRHASHQSIPSTSSISNSNDASSEYRYGPSGYVSVNNNSSELSSASAYSTDSANGTSSGAGGAGSTGAPSSAGGHTQQPPPQQSQPPPPRDYYPPSTSWTTTAGEPSSIHAYHNGGATSSESSRPYAFPGKSEHPPPPGSYASTINHYSWSPT